MAKSPGRIKRAVEVIAPSEAAILFEKLRELGHVTAAHVRDARAAIEVETQEIVDRLSVLRATATGESTSVISKVRRVRPAWQGTPNRGRRLGRVSAKRRETMRLQGLYLGLLHQMSDSVAKRFRADIPKRGKAAVVAAMQAYVRKHAGKSTGAKVSKK